MNEETREITDEFVPQELKDKQQATADAKKVKEVKPLERYKGKTEQQRQGKEEARKKKGK